MDKCKQCGREFDPAESKRKGLPHDLCSLQCATAGALAAPDDDDLADELEEVP